MYRKRGVLEGLFLVFKEVNKKDALYGQQ